MDDGVKVLHFGNGLAWDGTGTTFLDEALHSDDCPGGSNGSADLWFDAMAALAHATNDSGAFGINRDTLQAA